MSEFSDREADDFIESSEQSQSSFSKNQESTETILDSMFSTAQRSEIADIMIAAVRSIQMQQFTSSFTNEAQENIQTFVIEHFKKWIADEIEFFDSNIDDDDSVVNVDRHVFYKNIYAFVDKLKNMITIREDDKLRTILSQCFRDAVLIWHFIELFDMKKDLLRQANLAS